jgi:hypothetical protein
MMSSVNALTRLLNARATTKPTFYASPDAAGSHPTRAFFAVKLGDSSGPVLATFSNRMAAERFAEKKRLKDQDAAKTPPDKASPP